MTPELELLKKGSEYSKMNAKLQKQALEMALSYKNDEVIGNTYTQVLKLARNALAREELQWRLLLIKEKLKKIPRGYAALLIAAYFKGISREAIAAKYGVSCSKVYRKLAKARALLARSLAAEGVTLETLRAQQFDTWSET